MKTELFIAPKLEVCYQSRSECKNGKMAYVTYKDQTGKFIREGSWNVWGSVGLGSNTFDNVPTDGFVINEHIDGRGGYWNRADKIRISDPRGFDVEIFTDNLIDLLGYCDCSKKEIKGKLVYAFNKNSFQLVCVDTHIYNESKSYTDSLFIKTSFNESDMVPGTKYKVKSKEEFIYIGKFKLCTPYGGSKSNEHLFMYSAPYCPTYTPSGINYKNQDKTIIAQDLKQVVAVVKENALTAEQVAEITEAINQTPYVASFWEHPENIIEKFVSSSEHITTPSYYENNSLDSFHAWKRFQNDQAKISEDGESVELYAPYEYYSTRNRYKFKYKYATIDLNSPNVFTQLLECIEISDSYKAEDYAAVGCYLSKDSHMNCKGLADLHHEETAKEIKISYDEANKECYEQYTHLYYITKAGYIVDGLQRIIEDENFYHSKKKKVRHFMLPVKI